MTRENLQQFRENQSVINRNTDYEHSHGYAYFKERVYDSDDDREEDDDSVFHNSYFNKFTCLG